MFIVSFLRTLLVLSHHRWSVEEKCVGNKFQTAIYASKEIFFLLDNEIQYHCDFASIMVYMPLKQLEFY